MMKIILKRESTSFLLLLSFIFFSQFVYGQSSANCGILSAFSYTTSTSSTSGNTVYNLSFTIEATSGGEKSIRLTVQIGTSNVINDSCYNSATGGGPANYTASFDVATGTVSTSWQGRTTSACGGTTCIPNGTTAVPVELIYFKAEATNKANLLRWSTASEQDNAGFQIEKSTNGKDWNILAWVEGNGNSNEVLEYTYEDEYVSVGTAYYRLKQIDFNGEYEYSDVVKVSRTGQTISTLYPNPTNGVLESSELVEGYTVTNTVGIVLLESNNPTQTIDLSSLSPGVYILQTRDEDNQVSQHKILLNN
jgi:hypothetical protein